MFFDIFAGGKVYKEFPLVSVEPCCISSETGTFV